MAGLTFRTPPLRMPVKARRENRPMNAPFSEANRNNDKNAIIFA